MLESFFRTKEEYYTCHTPDNTELWFEVAPIYRVEKKQQSNLLASGREKRIHAPPKIFAIAIKNTPLFWFILRIRLRSPMPFCALFETPCV